MKCAVLTAGRFVAAVQTVCVSVAHVDRTETAPIVASHPVPRTFYSQHTLAALIHRYIPMTNRSTTNQRKREERERQTQTQTDRQTEKEKKKESNNSISHNNIHS